MEPMALGSAPSSPASPGINPNFLPGFLMGGDNQPTPPNPSISPGRNRHSSGNFNKVGANVAESRGLRQKLFNQSIPDSRSPISSYSVVPEKTVPPPMGLFDTLGQKKKSTPMSSTVGQLNDSMIFNESISRINDDNSQFGMRSFNDTISRTPVGVSSGIDTHWVTVFGFPPSALTVVLSHLANCGPIAEKKIPPQGNWVHIKFNNISEVSRALSLNCKFISPHIMIGVTPFYNKENKENDSTAYTSPTRVRSLRHSFISPSAENSVVSPQVLPQKSTGIVTKAMEYVFGW